MAILIAIQGIVIVLLAVLVVGLLRSHAEILRALHDLGINLEDGAADGRARTFELGARPRSGVAAPGTPVEERIGESGLAAPVDGPLGVAHDLMGITPAGSAAAISVGGGDSYTLLAFLTSGCASCLDFWEAFRDPANRRIAGRDSSLVVLTKGPEAESPAQIADLAHPDVNVLLSTEAYDDYSVPIAPYFVLIDSSSKQIIGEGAAASFDQLRSLLSKATADSGRGLGSRRSRRDVLGGSRRQQTADEALEAAGIGPGHPSLTEDPNPHGGAPS
jgi:hypothetical protein